MKLENKKLSSVPDWKNWDRSFTLSVSKGIKCANNFIISHQKTSETSEIRSTRQPRLRGWLFCDVSCFIVGHSRNSLTSLPPVVQDGNPEAPLGPVQRLHIATFSGHKQRAQPAERDTTCSSPAQYLMGHPSPPQISTSISNLSTHLCAFRVWCLSSRTVLDKTKPLLPGGDETLNHRALNLSESLCYLSLLVPALVPSESGHLLLPGFMKPSLVPSKWHKSLQFSSSAHIILTPMTARMWLTKLLPAYQKAVQATVQADYIPHKKWDSSISTPPWSFSQLLFSSSVWTVVQWGHVDIRLLLQ